MNYHTDVCVHVTTPTTAHPGQQTCYLHSSCRSPGPGAPPAPAVSSWWPPGRRHR